ncbi:Rna recognition motif xs domain protein [Thalictrum thalictroides]|uniref:Rna recognition motif xs domain protein n=1 Tax=Thalictrum thalictroides TaxID=46969 RepID=A0A7J6WRD3_THATH|nr:Rna recognition motif xs domain protein [Thalictrum thalictroides]
MTGVNPNNKVSSYKPSPSSSHRKSRWESGKNPPHSDNNNNSKSSKIHPFSDTKSSKPSSTNPNPKEDPSSGPSKPSPKQQIPPPAPGPPPGPAGAPPYNNEPIGATPFPHDPSGFGPLPQPAYGFHMLDRRTIALADGSVRSYFALPPDYQDLPPQARPPVDFPERFMPFGQGGRGGDGERGGMHFPPGGRLSPDGFRRGGEREEMFGRGGQNDYRNSLGLDGRGPMPPEGMLKRKYGEGDERDGRDPRDEFARQRQQLLQYGNPNLNPSGFPAGSSDRTGHMAGTSSPFHRDHMEPGRGLDDMRASKHMKFGGDYDLSSGRNVASDVDQQALKKAFLRYVKLINENALQKTNYLENGKKGPLQCLACSRASKEFPDMHGLIMHAYSSHSADLHVDHLGLHKALCVLMGWNYAKVPDNSKVYQTLSAHEAEANKDDLILWPPLVIIHNTNTGRGKDGLMEGMGNKLMDSKLKDLGFGGGKAKSVYSKEGHLGFTVVKFAADQSGLKEAMRLADFFEKDYHGRIGWARTLASKSGRDDENNPNLVKVDEKTREKQRILYGYLATVSDLEVVDFETRKKASIESKRELRP